MTAPQQPRPDTVPADLRSPLPKTVIERGADTDSSHGFTTASTPTVPEEDE